MLRDELAEIPPRDLLGNLRWRLAVEKASRDDLMRDAIELACAKSCEFWISTFCWSHDPRRLGGRRVDRKYPFILWPYQRRIIQTIDDCVAKNEHLVVEKSRDMGATVVILKWIIHRCLFMQEQSFLVLSRKMDLVVGKRLSLFGLIRDILENLPDWILADDEWDFNLTAASIRFFKTGSVIEGEATVPEAGRGDRRTAIMADEFGYFPNGGFQVMGAMFDATNLVIMNSTPNGRSTAMYTQRSSSRVLSLHWSEHPEKSRGLYRVTPEGRIEVLDPSGLPKDYEFSTDIPKHPSGFRSPWYDRECKRRRSPTLIAQELDLDYHTAGSPVFDALSMERLLAACEPPIATAELTITGATASVNTAMPGDLKLWVPIRNGKAPPDIYVMGCDISQGLGATPSSVAIWSKRRREKVAAWASKSVGPAGLARVTATLGAMFMSATNRHALLNFERNGPGETFAAEVEGSYSNLWYADGSDKSGYYNHPTTKNDLILQYRDAMIEGRIVNKDIDAVRECGEYVFKGTGNVEHAGLANTHGVDAGANHGDLVIADAIAVRTIDPSEDIRPAQPEPTSPVVRTIQDRLKLERKGWQ